MVAAESTALESDIAESLCSHCFHCWSTSTDGRAQCDAFPSGEYHGGIPIHRIIIVSQRTECEFFEEDDDWGDVADSVLEKKE